MGAAVSGLTRRIQRFNIENRAHREISKEKPTPAPTYPSTAREIERLSRENPEFIEQQARKDKYLHERLKSVYLKSYDVKEEPKSKASDAVKSLPINRSTPEETDLGFIEPKMISRGRVTLRQALKFIAEYQADPKSSVVSTIAAQHHISLEMTENILKYFRTFEIYIPDNKEKIGGERTTVTHIEGGKPIE
ncbi:NADH dehydrogenase [ubiquinone] 1 alpha subcomplex assembly factor 4-like [Hetaerina americana]|uniref:NADH dehydrogenase [ubiquinone] 1 alpha subcomplex assembly factor 4-like n=1 Tax=Hetaerina americana TaxID=62018 RepID=UPI003A7F4F95